MEVCESVRREQIRSRGKQRVAEEEMDELLKEAEEMVGEEEKVKKIITY